MTYNEMMIDDLLHKIEMQNQKIGDMDKEIERLHKVFDIKDDERCKLVKENKEMQRIINDLQSELAGATNENKLASYEISVLNKYIDKLTTENNDLKFRFNMFKKVCLNSVYGITGTKHTDSIKVEKNNDI